DQRRVVEEMVEGGTRIYGFGYFQSSFTAGIGSWMYKTVETLPGGTQNVIYTNYAGQVMLAARVPGAGQPGNGPWYDAYLYNSQVLVAAHAFSSAITGYSEGYSDLLHYQASSSRPI